MNDVIDESQYPEIEVLSIGSLGPEYDDKHCIRGPNGSTVWVPKSMSRRERWAVNQGLHPNYPTGEQCQD